jgi:hypothetical protein
MSENEVKQVIRDQAKAAYLNKTIAFGTDKFKVRSLKVRATSRAIPKSDYDDYGVDEDTVKFFVVEFCDTEDDFWATNCVCSILTLNSKGQIGSADVPYDFDYEGTSADFTIAFAEKINAIVAAKQR